MGQRIRRGALAALCLCMLLTASGCGFTLSPEDLYSLPQLPAEYTELNNSINALVQGEVDVDGFCQRMDTVAQGVN